MNASASFRLAGALVLLLVVLHKTTTVQSKFIPSSSTSSSIKSKLRGVTVLHEPYSTMDDDGKIKGFIVDLMDKISEKSSLLYELYLSPDGSYGTPLFGNISGMVGEVVHKKADFAIADLTVTEARARYVDFTEPFLTTHLAALVRKEDVSIKGKTLADLVQFTEQQNETNAFVYGSIASGATVNALSKTNDTIGQKIYKSMSKNNKRSMINLHNNAMERVQAGHYALVVESTSAEYLATLNCNLTVFIDDQNIFNRHYAIALPKENASSNLKKTFNQAIGQLKAEGTIEALRRQYWFNKCDASK